MTTTSYLEHVAIRVQDIHWHIRFFSEVLGQEMRQVDGTVDKPIQYWTLGGLQFMAAPELFVVPSNEAGWGILVLPSELINQRDEVVQCGEHRVMIPMRSS